MATPIDSRRCTCQIDGKMQVGARPNQKHTRVILRSHVCVYVHLKRLTKDAMRSTTCPNVHRCLPSALRNVEQYFSRAGQLSDPNMDAEYLGTLTSIGVNKAVHTSPRPPRSTTSTSPSTVRQGRSAKHELSIQHCRQCGTPAPHVF